MKVKTCVNSHSWGARLDLDFPRIYVWIVTRSIEVNVTILKVQGSLIYLFFLLATWMCFLQLNRSIYIEIYFFLLFNKGSQSAIFKIFYNLFCKVFRIFRCRYITGPQAWFQNRTTLYLSLYLFIFLSGINFRSTILKLIITKYSN